MKSLIEITNIIAKQIGKIAYGSPEDNMGAVAPDCKIIVCPERIFTEDYLEQRNNAINTNADEVPSLNGEEPNFTYFSNTIFFVIKVGGGQRNMAVSNSEVNIQVLSEENDFVVARDILDAFVAKYNFKYSDGIAQSYFLPEFNATQESVYTGFRALLSVRGMVRIPESGFLFATDVVASFDYDGKDYEYHIPFLNYGYSFSSQTDPQAFAGFKGMTKALNRQGTETISMQTYLPYVEGEDDAMNAFTMRIMRISENINAKFHLTVKFVGDGQEFSFVDGFFVLAGSSYSQELADLAPWQLTFTSAKESE